MKAKMEDRLVEQEEYRTFGPPGTGKTSWLAEQAEEAAALYGGDQVSICSLTNSAVREVVSRDIGIQGDHITTLHARCKRSLGAPEPAETHIRAFADDHPEAATEDCVPMQLLGRVTESDDEPLAERILTGGGGELTYMEQAQILRQRLVQQEAWPWAVRTWFDTWERWCLDNGIMDFTGWLEDVLRREGKPLPPQQAVFVDEAQDHTPLQLEVLRKWSTHRLTLIGDDDQNLYEWAGSVPKAFFSPPLPSDRELVLERSYRVPEAVHAVATPWISKLKDRREKTYYPREERGRVMKIPFSVWDAADVVRIVQEATKCDHTVMVLTSCAYMLEPVLAELRKSAIPFHNPYRRSHSSWNPLRTAGAALEAFLAPAEENRRWTGSEVVRWGRVLEAGMFRRGMKKRFLDACRYAGSSEIDGGWVEEYLDPSAYSSALMGDLSLIQEHRVKKARTANWEYALRVFSKPRDERDPQVIVGTIHSVKGGEADTVLLFPDLSPAGFAELTSMQWPRLQRLFYVGMTRARQVLWLGSPGYRYSVW